MSELGTLVELSVEQQGVFVLERRVFVFASLDEAKRYRRLRSAEIDAEAVEVMGSGFVTIDENQEGTLVSIHKIE